LSIDARRLLGLAFASADLLLEVDGGRVTLVLGATQKILGQGESAIMGRGWPDLFAPEDRALMEAVLLTLDDGGRRGPVTVRLAGETPRCVSLSLRALPDNQGRVSVSMAAAPPPAASLDELGLRTRENFEDIAKSLFEAARATGLELELAMVDFTGLDMLMSSLAEPDARALESRMAGAVRSESHAGGMATKISADRYALVMTRDERSEGLADRLTRATNISAKAHVVPMDGAVTARSLRAVRYALDDFLREGLKESAPATLSEAMNRSVKRTLARAGALGAAVSQRRFTLAFQPVVDLSTGLAHHHEVLVRFEDGASPYALIRMAEEFDIIEELDHATVEQAVQRLAGDRSGKLRLAVNVSGRTIGNEAYVDHIGRLLAKHDAARGRLIFEITETTAIDDLTVANAHIQSLRAMGSLVCLDDFGSGASSFRYLQELSLDIVKIDGRYVREMAASGRDGAMVRRLVELCGDLKIRTVAEMVETPEVEEIIRKAGVDFAQGWLFGRPADTPQPALNISAVKPMARRAGVSEGWG